MGILIILFLILVIMVTVPTMIYAHRKKKALNRFDVNHVREIEKEIWGYYFTTPEAGSKEETHDLNEQLKSVGVRQQHEKMLGLSGKADMCVRCNAVKVFNGDTCQTCTLNAIREKRYKIVEFNGQYYKAHLPAEVPDHAHCEAIQTWDQSYMNGTWVAFKWTDEKTGKQMGVRATALPVDKHDIYVDQYDHAIANVYTGM